MTSPRSTKAVSRERSPNRSSSKDALWDNCILVDRECPSEEGEVSSQDDEFESAMPESGPWESHRFPYK